MTAAPCAADHPPARRLAPVIQWEGGEAVTRVEGVLQALLPARLAKVSESFRARLIRSWSSSLEEAAEDRFQAWPRETDAPVATPRRPGMAWRVRVWRLFSVMSGPLPQGFSFYGRAVCLPRQLSPTALEATWRPSQEEMPAAPLGIRSQPPLVFEPACECLLKSFSGSLKHELVLLLSQLALTQPVGQGHAGVLREAIVFGHQVESFDRTVPPGVSLICLFFLPEGQEGHQCDSRRCEWSQVADHLGPVRRRRGGAWHQGGQEERWVQERDE